MKKLTKVLSIISLVFAALGMLLFAIFIANRGPFMSLFVGANWAEYPFVLPVGYLIYIVGMLVCALLLLKGRQSRHIGIEITLIILLFVIPRIQTLVTYVQTTILGNYRGSLYYAGLSAMNTVCSFAGSLSGIAAFLMLLACGLRIGYKKTKREQL